MWNWRNGIDLPKLIHDHRILEVLFGDNADLTNWRKDLEDALEAARAAKRKKATGAPRTTFAKTRPIAPPTAYFMGRDEEIATLASRLASATDLGPMLIQGGPGIGKTELTRAIAHQEAVVARFADRRYFVPLDHSVDAESMQHAIMRAVGFEPRYGFAAMLNALREQETLLVLDNLETPWQSQYGPTEEVLAELATIPQVAVLASFRGREAVGGARWHQYALEALPYHSSCDLFCSIAGQKFLSDPLLERFLTALSGNPLAISLVAQRAYGRASLDPLWREWLQNGTRFIEEPQDMGDGITSFAASVDRTFQSHQMTRDALRFLQIATLFPFGLGRREAKIIMGDGAFAAAEAVVRLGLTAEAGHKSGSGVYTYLKVPELILTHVRTFYPINDADQLLVDQFRQTAAALWKDVAACRRATIDEVARFYDAEDDWGP
ncbi:MAG: hypothetical protein Q27BB25_06440 [Blastomonas sp. CACIA14H2]|uniref:NB-ARC domain-containing protein n=1 Tax=Blastomonas sp. CACIA14H2 TaxID=1419876 RepID=UPI0003D00B04|nr:MAG: hypothetical protein Q27BB25_06440 [Blastomonas sp. CACIA14H2]